MLVAGMKSHASSTPSGRAAPSANGQPRATFANPKGIVSASRKYTQRGRNTLPQKTAGRRIGESRISATESPRVANRPV